MKYIQKLCKNPACGYLCYSDPEEWVYANADTTCPACDAEKSLCTIEISNNIFLDRLKMWWKKHREQ